MEISVKADFKKVTRYLTKVQRKQIPFATVGALNDTAFQSRTVAVKEMDRFLDRPTPATKRGLMVGKAKKTHLESKVFFKDFVWQYMKYQVLGGTRSNVRKIAVPGRTLKLNKYGNIPGRRGGLIKKGNFVTKAGDITAIFKPIGKKNIKLIAVLVDRATYRPRYPFYKIIQKAVQKRFKSNFRKSMARALLTAR